MSRMIYVCVSDVFISCTFKQVSRLAAYMRYELLAACGFLGGCVVSILHCAVCKLVEGLQLS